MREVSQQHDTLPVSQENYLLLHADFKKIPPESPVPYQAGDRITRENFISFLINAFAISMGIPEALRLYFHWLLDNEGFDAKETVRNFMRSKGWDHLSEEERALFFHAVRSRKRHLEVEEDGKWAALETNGWQRGRNFSTSTAVGKELDSELGQLFKFSLLKRKPIVPREELRGMPLRELIQRIRAWKKNLPKE